MGRISGSALLDGVQWLSIQDLQNRWSVAIWPGKPSTRTYQVFANKWSAPELSSESRLPGWASSYPSPQMDTKEKREMERERVGGRWWEWEWARNGEGRCWITHRDAQSLVSLYHTNATWADVPVSLSQIWALAMGDLHNDEKAAICTETVFVGLVFQKLLLQKKEHSYLFSWWKHSRVKIIVWLWTQAPKWTVLVDSEGLFLLTYLFHLRLWNMRPIFPHFCPLQQKVWPILHSS